MTVIRPNQSPSSPRARVSNTWPTTGDFKPLPVTPTDSRGLPTSEALFSPSQAQQRTSKHDKETFATPEEGGTRVRGNVDSGTAYIPEGYRMQQTTPPRKPLASNGSTDPPPLPALSTSVEEPSARIIAPSSPSSNNPFRQKDLTINTKSTYHDISDSYRPGQQAQVDQPSSALQTSPRIVEIEPKHAPRIPDKAPRLDWQDPRSPVDPTGFSGGYFNELQELHQGIINSGSPKEAEIGPYEAEAIDWARKSTLQPNSLEVAKGPSASNPSLARFPSEVESQVTSAVTRAQYSDAPAASNREIPAMHPDAPFEPDQLGERRRKTPSLRSASKGPSPVTQTSPFTQPSTPARIITRGPSNRDNQSRSPKPRKTSEVYQIRQVNWYDATSPTNPRRSPIMVQNENGPCPLLALVNALVLSTPSVLKTALCETLRVREQVTLGLLLDAVIDELMSERRVGSSSDLPDVGDLYTFLLGLHTGMNVNPRFVPPRNPNAPLINFSGTESRSPTRRRLGGFEETSELELYGTFGLPVIHGWIPPSTHPAFEVFARVAPTYEEAQNLLFLEEDLERKMKDDGLTTAEQRLLEDIDRINLFLRTTATQLTAYGLESLTECLAPGSLSILFRNDHFSTLYKHPQSGQLLTLVTDMGYAGHDEVVWESLVDVNGEGSEFFAGDFRPVGNVVETTEHTGFDEDGWQTVTRKPRKPTQTNTQSPPRQVGADGAFDAQASESSQKNSEQEDLDLALALQLQDEEDENLRRQTAARRDQDQRNAAFVRDLDPVTGRRTFPGFGHGARGGGPPTVPPRGGRGGSGPGRQVTGVHRPAGNDEDLPPPSYEQAAQGMPYNPPPNHPQHPSSSPLSHQRTSSSAYAENSAQQRAGGVPHSLEHGPPSLPRRPKGRSSWGPNSEISAGQSARRSNTTKEGSHAGNQDAKKEKDCIVM